MTICLRSGRSPRMPLMRLRRSGVTMSALAPLSSRRSFTGSGPKAENRGPAMAPTFSMPKKAT